MPNAHGDWVAPREGVDDWVAPGAAPSAVSTIPNPFQAKPVDDWVAPAAPNAPAATGPDDWVSPGAAPAGGMLDGVIDDRMRQHQAEQPARLAAQAETDAVRIPHMLLEPQSMQDIVDYYHAQDGTQFKTQKEALERFVSDRRWVDSNEVSAAKELYAVQSGEMPADQMQRLARLRQRWAAVPAGGEGLESVLSNVWRGALAPSTLLTLGMGKVLGKGVGLAAGVATDAAISGALNQAEQRTEQTLGNRQDLDWQETATAAGIGGGASVLGHGVAAYLGSKQAATAANPEILAAQVKKVAGGLGDDIRTSTHTATTLHPERAVADDGSTLIPAAPGVPPTHAPPTEAFTDPLGKVGAVNLQRMEVGDEIKNILIETHQTDRGMIDEARRGVRSHEETVQAANNLGFTDADIKTVIREDGTRGYTIKTGSGVKALSAEELWRTNDMLIQSAARVKRLATDAIGGSDAAKAAFQIAMDRHREIQGFAEGAFTEAGRALNILRKISTDESGLGAKVLRGLIDSRGGDANVETLAKLVANTDSVGELSRFASEMEKVTFGSKLVEAWYNALLSGPTTHAVNLASNAATQGLALTEKTLAAGIGSVRRALGGTGDRYTLGELGARAQVYGSVSSMLDAVKAGARAFVTDTPASLTGGVVEHGGPKIGGLLGHAIRVPQKLLGASDDFFKLYAYRAELHQQAYATVAKRLAPGTEGFEREVAQLVANPSRELRDMATAEAERLTFTNTPGAIAQAASALANAVPGGRLILPFVRTPANILTFAFQRSPLGLLYGSTHAAFSKGGKEADEALARMALGTSAMGVSMWLGSMGLVTGSAPTDPMEKNLWDTKKIAPQSIKVGGQWYSYGRFDPASTLLSMGADLNRIAKSLSGNPKAEDVIGTLVGVVSENLIHKTWLQGLANTIEAFKDSKRYGSSWAANLAGTLVPTGVAQVSRAIDPTLHDTRSIIDALVDRTPFRSGLAPRVDLLGEVQRYDAPLGGDSVLARTLSPVYAKREVTDPVRETLWRLKVAIQMPDRKMDGVELNPEQYYELAAIRGRLAKNALERAVSTTAFQQAPPAAQAEYVKGAFATAGASAKSLVLRMNRDLQQKIGSEKVRKFFEYEVQAPLDPRARQMHILLGNQ